MSSWPPTSGLTTKVVSRNNVILPIHASTTVQAPASKVWSVLLESKNYPAWNTFCTSVIIHSQSTGVAPTDTRLRLGTTFTFRVVMDSTKPDKITDTQLRVTDISTPDHPSDYIARETLDTDGTFTPDLGRVFRVAWTTEGGFVARGLKSERFHEVIVIGDGECEVRTWECQGGPLARAVKWMYGKVLPRKFEEWCADLKGESEKQWQEEKTT